ncbi:carbohydrate ABC transporter permease [Arcanobacterium pinnipediorum]|uniref:Carbohydrate ABC transporter permease n=1 Tax=Arcanobacterium pinnipediorum TaxID=1503041 RepID=A0ABY5AH51_9ACTO|nr:carbohydrate ABC transporter permease [Arcanobacterium pinnipediorum]USR79182.1 carbohydrate ABC transporter permease [Arcanobacterium pinnipediorum]
MKVKKLRQGLSNTSSVLGIIGIVVFCLAPFYWMFISSIRPATKIFETSLWPSEISFENYGAVFDPSRGFGRALVNSVIVAGTTTVLALVVATFTAYALARLQFRGKTFILTVIVATSMFPIVAIIVPLLQLFTDIGWINTYQAMILPSLSFALPLAVWNLHSFFRQMPVELEQAALIDGCTPGQAFRKIIMPLAAPGVFTTAIIVFITAWNEFMIAVTMINDQAMQTAPVAISKFGGVSQFETPYGSQMAAGIVVTIPLVILVLIFQRRIVAGLAAGGVK